MLEVRINSVKRLNARRKVKNVVNLEKIAASRIPEWWLEEYFGPLECFVEHIEKGGTLDVSASDLSLNYHADGKIYHPISGMLSMAEVFKLAQMRDASCPGSGGLFLVAGKLGAGNIPTVEEIRDFRGCLRELREYARSRSRSQMVDLIRTACIKLELRKHDEACRQAPGRAPASSPRSNG